MSKRTRGVKDKQNQVYTKGLPINEIWEQRIFPYLSLAELLSARHTCKLMAARIPQLVTRVELAHEQAAPDFSIFSNVATCSVLPSAREIWRVQRHNPFTLIPSSHRSLKLCNLRHIKMEEDNTHWQNVNVGTALQRLELIQTRGIDTEAVLSHSNLRHMRVDWYADGVDFAAFRQLRYLVTLELVGCGNLTNETISSLSSLSTLALPMCRGVTEISNPHLMCLDISCDCTVYKIHPAVMCSLRVLSASTNASFTSIDLANFPNLDLLLLNETQEVWNASVPPRCEVHQGLTVIKWIGTHGFYDTIAECYGYTQKGWQYREFPPVSKMVRGTCNTDFILGASL